MTGINFIEVGKNSASKIIKFSGKINKALPQKSVPTPIIISLVTYPIKILPKDKINNGNPIANGAS
jgi:hypothetical protein